MSKVQPSLTMLGREKRVFSLDHSLHVSLFQVLADSVWGERTLLGAKSRDGRDMNTSGRGNKVSSLTCIKEVKNPVFLSRREGFHDDGG
ncbi:hypothetical protein SERLA73DRAFT_128471 [Serpula lacrymans var. lacrymans S7.3]|uniref:Uncharacterized protein n=1 Tax=Serpula lacrymans var. lacrymans (strain S7.3) TaxID=936435 RepID=F8PGN1_SERL3|nr:hypothetical protein SERLA73DRAFT_128471 [Serpula lacrymans var. lacrymans S7.3]